MKPIQLRQWCQETFHDYVVFTNSIFFILGLIFSYKLVEKTFFNILITRLSYAWDVYDLRRATVVVNLQEGTSAVLVAFFAYVADVYTGRFQMVVFSTAVCITGLLLNSLAAGNDENGQLDLGLFYPALGLMALAQAAQTVTLQAFLDDQLMPRDLAAAAADDIDRRRRHTKFWWILASFVAAIFAQFGPLAGFQFRKLALVLIALIGGCLVVFLLGTKYYNFIATIPDPFKHVGIVIFRAIANRNVEYPQTPQGLFDNSHGDLQISPRIPWLRWLDRAAIVTEMEAGRRSPWSVEQVRRVKLLLKMLPLWSSFLTLSLVAAAGSTFFFEEAIDIYGKDDLRLIIFFVNLVRFTEFVVSETSSYVVRKLRERKQYNKQKMELVRIGIGMSCCVPCCIVGWVTETRRQQWASEGYQANMRVYWLIPQYILLGLMGGLSGDGLQSFYESQVSQSLSRFGPPFEDFVMGVGKFMSVLCILVLSRKQFEWFQIKINDSRLDKYYILLAVLSFGNVIIYCLVACWYGDDAFLLEEVVEVEQEMDVDQLVAGADLGGPEVEVPSNLFLSFCRCIVDMQDLP